MRKCESIHFGRKNRTTKYGPDDESYHLMQLHRGICVFSLRKHRKAACRYKEYLGRQGDERLA